MTKDEKIGGCSIQPKLPPPSSIKVAQKTNLPSQKKIITTIKKKQYIPPPLPPKNHEPSKGMKIGSMDHNVMDLLGKKQHEASSTSSVLLPPLVPTFTRTRAGNDNNNRSNSKKNRIYRIKVGNKTISSIKPCRKWEWAAFTTSARSDGQEFRHWVRAGLEYPDYPYARFDIHLDHINYTDEEYSNYLQHKTWTKSDTDRLMELARVLELRWVVIYDRWISTSFCYNDSCDNNHYYKIEDLQHRFYTVAAILGQTRIAREAALEVSTLSTMPNADSSEQNLMETAAARSLATGDLQHQPLMINVATGTSNKEIFDLEEERERRAHLELSWNRTREEEEEEQGLRKELKLIEIQLRKLKKNGGHTLLLSAGVGCGGSSSLKQQQQAGSSVRNSSGNRAVSPLISPSIATTNAVKMTTALLDKAFASTSPVPMPGTPYLQSGRMKPPGTGGSLGINKALLKRMNAVLEELKLKNNSNINNNSNNKQQQQQQQKAAILPTKRTCDMYDSVRKDVLTLLIIQKAVIQKEGQLQTKRLRLAKRNNNSGTANMSARGVSSLSLVEEESIIMGITQPATKGTSVTSNGPLRTKSKTKPRSSSASSNKNSGSKAATTKSTATTSSSSQHHHNHTSSKGDTSGGATATNTITKSTKKTASKKRKKIDTKPTTTVTAAVAASTAATTSPVISVLSLGGGAVPTSSIGPTTVKIQNASTIAGSTDEKAKKRTRKA
mmetsp:Transcript_20724/g.23660  ORF Transcript_20724/g.23660 Transcript_20724/m.23660 type:complete len:724 (-) Transcript_20724:82-2253(-)|eukprot:CAMPEP_0194188164 /NCGR_PEP_ID=MMETSP0154-20130528/53923_1 /TAXON_ID=1049557 /ORGANISM="Thalassiothrix antarctica, Strain L6-D1" /LENGTH=723 /DNA_ID=CAMNT_0038908405 /DNA_START=109 /DNA_END=2280 /DNA_ORIENTATION=-